MDFSSNVGAGQAVGALCALDAGHARRSLRRSHFDGAHGFDAQKDERHVEQSKDVRLRQHSNTAGRIFEEGQSAQRQLSLTPFCPADWQPPRQEHP